MGACKGGLSLMEWNRTNERKQNRTGLNSCWTILQREKSWYGLDTTVLSGFINHAGALGVPSRPSWCWRDFALPTPFILKAPTPHQPISTETTRGRAGSKRSRRRPAHPLPIASCHCRLPPTKDWICSLRLHSFFSVREAEREDILRGNNPDISWITCRSVPFHYIAWCFRSTLMHAVITLHYVSMNHSILCGCYIAFCFVTLRFVKLRPPFLRFPFRQEWSLLFLPGSQKPSPAMNLPLHQMVLNVETTTSKFRTGYFTISETETSRWLWWNSQTTVLELIPNSSFGIQNSEIMAVVGASWS